MEHSELLRLAIIQCVKSLSAEEYLGTVDVGEIQWDVYVHTLPQPVFFHGGPRKGESVDAITVALRLKGEPPDEVAEVGTFLPGRVTLAEVSVRLHPASA